MVFFKDNNQKQTPRNKELQTLTPLDFLTETTKNRAQ